MARYFNPNRRRNFFEKILMEVPSTNTFDLTHSNKLSFNMGELVPVLTQEVYPGDKLNITEMHMLKMAPLVTPVMHRCKVDFHTFFIPFRLLWSNFEKFQAYDTLNEIPPHPYVDAGNSTLNPTGTIEVGSLADYLDVPTTDGENLTTYPVEHPLRNLNAMIIAGYFKVYNDYYRDQNLQDEFFKEGDVQDGNNSSQAWLTGLNSVSPFQKGSLLKRAWEKDYFTSCLPFAQKGQEVVLPLGTSAPIDFVPPSGIEDSNYIRNASGDVIDDYAGDHLLVDPATGAPGNPQVGRLNVDDGGSPKPVFLDNSKTLRANLEEATAASVNSLRLAVRMQEFFERNARLGTRYIEQMLGKFGVRINDARAHRSELIGSSSSYINFTEVLQTSQTDTTPLAQQAGHGMNLDQGNIGNFFVEEHGMIMTIMSVLPETSYQQGLPKKWYKKDILDYYDPMFANLGEQEVKSWEIYATDPDDYNETFGYQSRYAELKYNMSTVHGEFRDALVDWHMGRSFSSRPELNDTFVQSDPTHRIYADTDPENQKLYCWVHFQITAKRKIPFYSTPSLSGLGT